MTNEKVFLEIQYKGLLIEYNELKAKELIPFRLVEETSD